MKAIFILFISFFYLIECSDPPTPEPPYNMTMFDNTIESIDNSDSSSMKNLEENSPDTFIENSTAVVEFLEDGRIKEQHQIIFTAQNLPSNHYYSSKNFVITLYKGQSLDVIENICEKKEKSENPDDNKCEVSISQMEDFYIFKYEFKLFNDEHIIINYTYIITKTINEILYRQESVEIPDYSGGFCNYIYIIPEGYTSLGIEDPIYLKKKEDNIYYYLDYCPLYIKTEIIRFTPKESAWTTNMRINLRLSSGFPYDINLTFPKYYQGGKINNSYYKIFSVEKEKYKIPNIISDDNSFTIQLPAKNSEKVGVQLNTAFTNVLNTEFNMIFDDSFLSINKSNIEGFVESRTRQILADPTFYKEYPDYYRIGKWIYKNIAYNTDYIGKNLSPREVLNLGAGVCEHFTKLYNTMLNSRNIKTAYITGWAFKKNETSGNEKTLGHTWTAAYINNKWIELDATWGLFEGVPSGHIIKTFFEDTIYYPPIENGTLIPSIETISDIQITTNISDLEDPFTETEDEIETDLITEQKEEIDTTNVIQNIETDIDYSDIITDFVSTNKPEIIKINDTIIDKSSGVENKDKKGNNKNDMTEIVNRSNNLELSFYLLIMFCSIFFQL